MYPGSLFIVIPNLGISLLGLDNDSGESVASSSIILIDVDDGYLSSSDFVYINNSNISSDNTYTNNINVEGETMVFSYNITDIIDSSDSNDTNSLSNSNNSDLSSNLV